MNFTNLVFKLYRDDEITFDADGSCNLSPLTIVDIQRHIAPASIFSFVLEDTLAYTAIKALHESVQYQTDNSQRIENAINCEQLKQSLRADFSKTYGVL